MAVQESKRKGGDVVLTCEVRTLEGESIGVLVPQAKTFRSGKQGYHGQAKLTLDGQRYQCQAQMVAIAGKSENRGAV